MQTPVLKTQYEETIVPEMMKSQGYKNRHQVPVVEKVVINSGVGSWADSSAIADTVKELSMLCGQRPVITLARKSVSNFKLRQGMSVGVKVTLRGPSMYEFLYRLISVALPGIRDFQGVRDKLDGRGNCNLGLDDHTIFPEVTMDTRKRNIGMDVAIVTSAETDEVGRELLRLMGMPFRKR